MVAASTARRVSRAGIAASAPAPSASSRQDARVKEMVMAASFDTTIKLSDILTSLSFLLAVLALVYNQMKDRQANNRARIAEARAVLSKGLAKLERWAALSESVFDEMQPTLVQASELWSGKEGDVIIARDYLWRELNRIYAGASAKILDEGLSTAYVDLYCVSKTLPEVYRTMFDDLSKLSQDTADTESAVLSFEDEEGPRVTALMGNKLRAEVARDREAFKEGISRIMAPVLLNFASDVAKGDHDLLAGLRRD
jgi:hypothetical protein